MIMNIKRFTAFRLMSDKTTHNEFQKNPDDVPQYEGVIWSDGTVTLRWLTACRSTSVWNSLTDMLNIHGHPEYGTYFIWHDGLAPPEWLAMLSAWEKKKKDLLLEVPKNV